MSSDRLSVCECRDMQQDMGKKDNGKRTTGSGLRLQERGFSCLGLNGPNEAEGEDWGILMVGVEED